MPVIKKRGKFRSDINKKDLMLTSLRLTKDSIKWMNDLSKEMKEAGGYKLPRSYIVRSILKAIKDVNFDLSGVLTEKQLENRILEGIRQYGK